MLPREARENVVIFLKEFIEKIKSTQLLTELFLHII